MEKTRLEIVIKINLNLIKYTGEESLVDSNFSLFIPTKTTFNLLASKSQKGRRECIISNTKHGV